MASIVDLLGQMGIFSGGPSEDEECGFWLVTIEQVEKSVGIVYDPGWITRPVFAVDLVFEC